MIRREFSGFTLIEVLVALAVFGVMSMLAYSALGSTLSNADYLTDRMERLQSVQRTVRYLSSDLLQLAPRPIRSELGDTYVAALRSALGSEFALELTHGVAHSSCQSGDALAIDGAIGYQAHRPGDDVAAHIPFRGAR